MKIVTDVMPIHANLTPYYLICVTNKSVW